MLARAVEEAWLLELFRVCSHLCAEHEVEALIPRQHSFVLWLTRASSFSIAVALSPAGTALSSSASSSRAISSLSSSHPPPYLRHRSLNPRANSATVMTVVAAYARQ